MRVVHNPASGQSLSLPLCRCPSRMHALLRVPSKQGQVENQRNPVSVDKEQEGQESVDGDFRDDVRVEAVAEVNRVDVVAAHIRGVSIDLVNEERVGSSGNDVADVAVTTLWGAESATNCGCQSAWSWEC